MIHYGERGKLVLEELIHHQFQCSSAYAAEGFVASVAPCLRGE